jgi:DNA-binding transcriptional LysR family regulator
VDRENASDLLAFLAVARERSFTRAAAKLRMSQPSLSQLILGLEERIGMRLLNRTTRSVTPTQIGERLLLKIGPKFEEIDQELSALSDLRDKPAGSIRISATDYAARMILLPALAKVLPKYPDIKVEVRIDYGLTDIIAAQFDAGIRIGELLEKDMIAVRVGPDVRIAVVAAPTYLSSRKTPHLPQDLTNHNCINFRFAQGDGLFTWRFEKDGRKLNVRVEGQLVFNDASASLMPPWKASALLICPSRTPSPTCRAANLSGS